MSNSTDEVSAREMIEENALIDARQLAESLDRPFTNSDIGEYKDAGIDLQLAAEVYVRDYTGTNTFLNSVRRYYNRRNTITSAQARAVLNVIRKDTDKKAEKPEKPEETDVIACIMCGLVCQTYDELDEHKSFEHGTETKKQAPVADIGEAADVLEVNASTKGLDLSKLPDGRYAAPDPSGNNDYIFLVVKRVRKTVHRDRRYNYGKIVTGNEIVVAGTIEVREWSSDSKEWIGAQKPGDVYRGKYEDQLELIMMMPEPWSTLFGRLLGYCGRCGKRLTDDESRAIGFGLDCEKTLATYWQGPKYTYIGADRPDPSKANPYDEKYIKGELNRWIEPPKQKQENQS